jgi:hypothetical protein
MDMLNTIKNYFLSTDHPTCIGHQKVVVQCGNGWDGWMGCMYAFFKIKKCYPENPKPPRHKNRGMISSSIYFGNYFICLAYQGKDIVFRFVVEYSSLRDFGPHVIIIGLVFI